MPRRTFLRGSKQLTKPLVTQAVQTIERPRQPFGLLRQPGFERLQVTSSLQLEPPNRTSCPTHHEPSTLPDPAIPVAQPILAVIVTLQ